MNDRPLLIGRSAARARDAVKRFSSALFAQRRPRRFDLCSGDAGLALVHAGLEQAFPGMGHARRAELALTASIRSIGRGATGSSLGSGFTGVAWAAEVLCEASDADEGGVDAAIEHRLSLGPRGHDAASSPGPYDLIAGLAGIGVYALERLPRPSAKRILARVVDALEASSVGLADGVAWRTDPAWLPPGAREPLLEWDLGVAHGASGVIAVLGRVCASDANVATKRKARRLLDAAVAWLLAQELPSGAGGSFPAAIGEGLPRKAARCAWCYGDPGIAAALLVAAQCTGESEWARAAARIAVTAAEREERDCGVSDAGLCHGAAGLGHLFHRLYRGTGDERLATAARRWLMQAVDMGERDARDARRARFVWAMREARGPVSLPGFFGAGGVALALLAATGDADAAWDRALGISAKERAA